MEKMLIRGVAKDNNVARVSIIGVPNQPGVAYSIFSLLASHKIDVDIILQSVGREKHKRYYFHSFQTKQRQSRSAAERVQHYPQRGRCGMRRQHFKNFCSRRWDAVQPWSCSENV